MRGILLFGHGARDPAWAEPFLRIRERVLASDPAACIECAFLELMQPSFAEAIDSLVRQGADDIVVVPVFIAAGGHVKQDLPHLVAQAMARHPGVAITLAAPVGEAAMVLQAMADYALGQGMSESDRS